MACCTMLHLIFTILRGAAVIVTAPLATLQAQRIEFHPKMPREWHAPRMQGGPQVSRTTMDLMSLYDRGRWCMVVPPKDTLDRGLPAQIGPKGRPSPK